MCEFLAWLDAQPLGDLTEIDVAITLEELRRRNAELLDISFDTISASGPNAALPHYRVTRQSIGFCELAKSYLWTVEVNTLMVQRISRVLSRWSTK